jgi:hypothetical protein
VPTCSNSIGHKAAAASTDARSIHASHATAAHGAGHAVVTVAVARAQG